MKETQKPHAVCIPYPAQGHISPMLSLAKLLHYKGFYITFVHTEFNYNRLLRSGNPNSVSGSSNFRFETIPDGLPPPENPDATQDVELCLSTAKNCLVPFRNLLKKLNTSKSSSTSDDDDEDDVWPPVSCIISDGFMSFTIEAAEELGIPNVMFWTVGGFSLMCYLHLPHLIERGVTPLKDSSYFTNGYMDTTIDWIPGIKTIYLRDMPTVIWSTDPNDRFIEYIVKEISRIYKGSAIILNTFDSLEPEILNPLSSILTRLYTIGPLHLLLKKFSINDTKFIGSNLWKEDPGCIEWLDSKEPGSVVYINFGSIAIMSPEHLVELAWGLANTMQNFLWIIRPDLVTDHPDILSTEFITQTKDRGFLATWCDQERVLSHPSVGGFLSHCGWNSTIESLSSGVAMICWPYFADQQTNCFCICKQWGVGFEIETDVKRENVEKVIRELMEGEKGKEMKIRAMEYKKKAEEAITGSGGGSSYLNLDRIIEKVLLGSS